MWDLSCGGQLPWSIDEESAAAGGCVRIQSWQLYGTDVASLSKTDRFVWVCLWWSSAMIRRIVETHPATNAYYVGYKHVVEL